MKTLLYLLFLLHLTYSQSHCDLELKLTILPELESSFRHEPIYIQIEGDGVKIDTVIKDITKIEFKNIVATKLRVDLYSSIKCSDSLTKKSFHEVTMLVMSDSSTTFRTINFPYQCDLNKYTGGRICPKCKKSDKVIPIIYGLADPLSVKGQVGVDYDLGTCSTTDCDPKWHCKRDNNDF